MRFIWVGFMLDAWIWLSVTCTIWLDRSSVNRLNERSKDVKWKVLGDSEKKLCELILKKRFFLSHFSKLRTAVWQWDSWMFRAGFGSWTISHLLSTYYSLGVEYVRNPNNLILLCRVLLTWETGHINIAWQKISIKFKLNSSTHVSLI